VKKSELEQIARKRDRIAGALTAATMIIYFGFILLVAWGKPLLATRIGSGLSVGIALGAAVIVLAWALTGIYVRWANEHYDRAVRDISTRRGS
jgi:uncharacterized membrane protein (DUF485 family)